jgi:hypothetical protein
MMLDHLRIVLVQALALEAELKRINSDEHLAELRQTCGPGSPYAGLSGELAGLSEFIMGHVRVALADCEHAARTLQGVEAYILDCRNFKFHYNTSYQWALSIPKTVTLECGNCHSQIECFVSREEDEGPPECAVYGASIETDICEDCGRLLCPKCQRFPHPDDPSLIRCAECASRQEVNAP